MECLGILSVREDKKGFLKKLSLKITLKEKFVTDFPIVVAEMPFTAEELEKIPQWIKKRLYKRGIAYLNCNGADYTAMALSYKKEREIIEKIPPELIKEATLYGLNFLEGNSDIPSVCISDRKCEAVDFHLLEELCKKVKQIGVITEDVEKAEKIGERLCDEYGIYPNICVKCSALPEAELQVYVDEGKIFIGKEFIISAVEYLLDTGAYLIDTKSLKERCPEFFFKYAHRAWLSGKKRLTR